MATTQLMNMRPILINAERFVSLYFQGAKTTENAKEIRIGNKGSKVVMKDGSGFFDHEEGNFTSMFNEIMRRENFSYTDACNYCKDNNLFISEHAFRYYKKPLKTFKRELFERDLIPFGFTNGHEYLKRRGIIDSTYPEHTLYWNDNDKYIAHKLVDINLETIGYQRIYVSSDYKKLPPPKIYGTSKGGKTVINIHDYETIILVEGLEDGLTLHQSYLLNNVKRTIWVMTGTSNFLNVDIPERTKRVILALDNDEAGEDMFQKCKERLSNLNKAVSRLRPKPEYNDFNDELRGIRINADK